MKTDLQCTDVVAIDQVKDYVYLYGYWVKDKATKTAMLLKTIDLNKAKSFEEVVKNHNNIIQWSTSFRVNALSPTYNYIFTNQHIKLREVGLTGSAVNTLLEHILECIMVKKLIPGRYMPELEFVKLQEFRGYKKRLKTRYKGKPITPTSPVKVIKVTIPEAVVSLLEYYYKNYKVFWDNTEEHILFLKSLNERQGMELEEYVDKMFEKCVSRVPDLQDRILKASDNVKKFNKLYKTKYKPNYKKYTQIYLKSLSDAERRKYYREKYIENKEFRRAWYNLNREKILEKQRLRNADPVVREQRRKESLEYYHNHKDDPDFKAKKRKLAREYYHKQKRKKESEKG